MASSQRPFFVFTVAHSKILLHSAALIASLKGAQTSIESCLSMKVHDNTLLNARIGKFVVLKKNMLSAHAMRAMEYSQ